MKPLHLHVSSTGIKASETWIGAIQLNLHNSPVILDTIFFWNVQLSEGEQTQSWDRNSRRKIHSTKVQQSKLCYCSQIVTSFDTWNCCRLDWRKTNSIGLKNSFVIISSKNSHKRSYSVKRKIDLRPIHIYFSRYQTPKCRFFKAQSHRHQRLYFKYNCQS